MRLPIRLKRPMLPILRLQRMRPAAHDSGLDGISALQAHGRSSSSRLIGMSVDHALEHVYEIGVGLDVVELGRFQSANRAISPSLAAAVAAGKEMIFAAERNRSDRAFDRVGVEFDAAVMQEARQTLPTRERVADRFGKRAASRYARKLRLEPSAQGLDDRLGARSAEPRGAAPATDRERRASTA